MAWRIANSIGVLRKELDRAWPMRTVPDWTIGDADHANRASDHNPNNSGVVCAVDIRPGNINLDVVFDQCVKLIRLHYNHPIKYAIYKDEICGRHTKGIVKKHKGAYHNHIHISVGRGPDGRSYGPYDDTTPWGIIEEEDMGRLDSEDLENIRDAVWEKTFKQKGRPRKYRINMADAINDIHQRTRLTNWRTRLNSRRIKKLTGLIESRAGELADAIYERLDGTADYATVRRGTTDAMREMFGRVIDIDDEQTIAIEESAHEEDGNTDDQRED